MLFYKSPSHFVKIVLVHFPGNHKIVYYLLINKNEKENSFLKKKKERLKNGARKQENPPLNFLQALASLPGGFLNFLALGKTTYVRIIIFQNLNYEESVRYNNQGEEQEHSKTTHVDLTRTPRIIKSPSNGYSSIVPYRTVRKHSSRISEFIQRVRSSWFTVHGSRFTVVD